MKLHVLALLTAVACLGHPALAADLNPPAAFTDYQITSWTGGDGIVLGEVRSIAQDQDKYLWLASDGGLVRFDGFHFATTDLVSGTTQLPKAPTRAVHIGRDGSLWVGYSDGYGVFRIARGEVQHVHLQHQLTGFVNAIIEDRSGAVWVGYDGGLQRLRNERWERVPLPGADPDEHVRNLREDRTGILWVGTTGGMYRRTAGGTFEKLREGEGRAVGFSEDSAGHVWTTDDGAGFRRADAADRNHLFKARGMDVFHDSRDNLWVTTVGQGIWQVPSAGKGTTPTVRHATVQIGLVNDENSDIFEDRDGNIWVGSIQGLTRFTPNRAASIVGLGVVRALTLGSDGTAWAGTTTGLIALTGATRHSRGTSRAISTEPVRALHTAGDGTVWAATDAGLRRVVQGHLQPVPLGGASLRRITSIASERHGGIWVCDDTYGVVRVAAGRVEPIGAATAGLSARPVLLHVDAGDRLWIAFQGGIIRTRDADGHIEQYGPEDGLAQRAIQTIHEDRWGDIWIGGDGGISRFRGNRFQTLSFSNESTRPVAAIMEDNEGDFWIAFAFFGFIRIGHDDMSRALDDSSFPRQYRVYNTGYTAGFPDVSHGGSAGRGSEGALWFLSSRGLTVIDPREIRAHDVAPVAPRVEGITADDRRYGAAADIVLPPRTSRLRIDYAVVNLSSSSERISFRYRLDGFDTNWVDGTGPRQALYTNLPPGSYRFRLQASNNATTWNETEAAWRFSIRPMFYQTGWFYSILAVGLVLASVGAWQLRVRQVRKELAMVFGERLRLSREIHDTLLQSLVGLALQLDSAAHSARDSSVSTRTQLMGMRRQVEDYVREVRQSIWDLRSPSLDRYGLIGALRATGERLTAGKVRFALTIVGTPRPCPPRVETHVLRIGHEAIMNAVRHANAQQVEMEIGFDEDRLRLRVVDDGRGMDPAHVSGQAPGSHYGLASMRERAADAGGRCTIESTSGLGVQVIAEFPLAPTA